MIDLRQFITEKLKVSSSANVSKIDFGTFAEALYIYCLNTGEQFKLKNLDYYKDLPDDEFPYFENPYSTLNAKGYIRAIAGGIYQEEYRIHLFYRETPDKKGHSVTTLSYGQFEVLTDAIEPEILQEIYDYLIDNA